MVGTADGNLDEGSIAVPDAILALRTFPRRFREALARVPAERLGDRPGPDSPSAVEEAAATRDVLQSVAAVLPRVLDAPGTSVGALDAAPVPSVPAIGAGAAETILGAIAAACDTLVTRADATPWEAWDRTFTVDGSTRAASWLVQHAAGEGSRRLRAIDRIASRFGGDAD